MDGEKNRIITASIYRNDPQKNSAPKYDIFQFEPRHPMTVLLVLRHIFRNIDATLSFRDFECYEGACTSCTMLVNGKRARACSVIVEPGEQITLEPLPGRELIKDLVVAFD